MILAGIKSTNEKPFESIQFFLSTMNVKHLVELLKPPVFTHPHRKVHALTYVNDNSTTNQEIHARSDSDRKDSDFFATG